MEKNLGLDRFQITVIRRTYGLIKPYISKREKAQKKLQDLEMAKAALEAEIQMYDTQIQALNKPVTDITERFCGITLTSEQVMDFIENPEHFEAYKQELGIVSPSEENEQDSEDYEENQGEGHDIDAEQEY